MYYATLVSIYELRAFRHAQDHYEEARLCDLLDPTAEPIICPSLDYDAVTPSINEAVQQHIALLQGVFNQKRRRALEFMWETSAETELGTRQLVRGEEK